MNPFNIQSREVAIQPESGAFATAAMSFGRALRHNRTALMLATTIGGGLLAPNALGESSPAAAANVPADVAAPAPTSPDASGSAAVVPNVSPTTPASTTPIVNVNIMPKKDPSGVTVYSSTRDPKAKKVLNKFNNACPDYLELQPLTPATSHRHDKYGRAVWQYVTKEVNGKKEKHSEIKVLAGRVCAGAVTGIDGKYLRIVPTSFKRTKKYIDPIAFNSDYSAVKMYIGFSRP